MEKRRTDTSKDLGLSKLSPTQLIHAYRTMFTARCLDDKELKLKRQNKSFFQMSGAGHEAIQIPIVQGARCPVTGQTQS